MVGLELSLVWFHLFPYLPSLPPGSRGVGARPFSPASLCLVAGVSSARPRYPGWAAAPAASRRRFPRRRSRTGASRPAEAGGFLAARLGAVFVHAVVGCS